MRQPGRTESALLRVRVLPRAGRDEVVGWNGTTLRVRVAAPPVDGEANHAMRALLAQSLGVPISAIALVRGARGRDKLVRVGGVSLDVLEARLKAALP